MSWVHHLRVISVDGNFFLSPWDFTIFSHQMGSHAVTKVDYQHRPILTCPLFHLTSLLCSRLVFKVAGMFEFFDNFFFLLPVVIHTLQEPILSVCQVGPHIIYNDFHSILYYVCSYHGVWAYGPPSQYLVSPSMCSNPSIVMTCFYFFTDIGLPPFLVSYLTFAVFPFICFIFKCVDDYYWSPECQNSTQGSLRVIIWIAWLSHFMLFFRTKAMKSVMVNLFIERRIIMRLLVMMMSTSSSGIQRDWDA